MWSWGLSWSLVTISPPPSPKLLLSQRTWLNQTYINYLIREHFCLTLPVSLNCHRFSLAMVVALQCNNSNPDDASWLYQTASFLWLTLSKTTLYETMRTSLISDIDHKINQNSPPQKNGVYFRNTALDNLYYSQLMGEKTKAALFSFPCSNTETMSRNSFSLHT